jgi:pilus assembly protein CpaE
MARRVLLMTNEPATASAVGTGLESNGRLGKDDVCRDFAELSAKLRDTRAQAALIDIDQPGALANLESLARHFADTRFVVLSSTMDSQRVIDSMQAGARHYLLKSSIASDLSGVLHRICPNGLAGRTGAVFTVLSAGGGAGCTTLAVNLAHELSLLLSADAGGRALLVDLDTCYGAVGPYLGVDTEYGIVDLLARSGPIDSQLIETASVPFGERMRVLVATAASRLGEAASFDPARLSAAVSACAGTEPVTVIDAPRVPIAAAQELVRDSDAALLLMQLTVKDVRTARRMLAHLAPGAGTGGEPAGSVIPIVSRYAKRGAMITLAEARQALGNIELQTLSNDWTAAAQSLNLGKPLAQTAARSDLRRDVQQLASRLASVHMKQSAPAAAAAAAGAKR